MPGLEIPSTSEVKTTLVKISLSREDYDSETSITTPVSGIRVTTLSDEKSENRQRG